MADKLAVLRRQMAEEGAGALLVTMLGALRSCCACRRHDLHAVSVIGGCCCAACASKEHHLVVKMRGEPCGSQPMFTS